MAIMKGQRLFHSTKMHCSVTCLMGVRHSCIRVIAKLEANSVPVFPTHAAALAGNLP